MLIFTLVDKYYIAELICNLRTCKVQHILTFYVITNDWLTCQGGEMQTLELFFTHKNRMVLLHLRIVTEYGIIK
jgi:hypothetical protein